MSKRTSWLLVATLFCFGMHARAQGPAPDQAPARSRQAESASTTAGSVVRQPAAARQSPAPAADLTLEECYRLAEANYPLTRQRALIEKTRDYSIANIAKGIYPQLDVNGTATYQSTVTSLNLPPSLGIPIDITLPKDQYKVYGEVSQTLT